MDFALSNSVNLFDSHTDSYRLNFDLAASLPLWISYQCGVNTYVFGYGLWSMRQNTDNSDF